MRNKPNCPKRGTEAVSAVAAVESTHYSSIPTLGRGTQGNRAKRTQFGPGAQPGTRVAARPRRGTTAPNKANFVQTYWRGKWLAGKELWYIAPAIGTGKTKPVFRNGPEGRGTGEPPGEPALRRIAPNKPNLRQPGGEYHRQEPALSAANGPEALTLPPTGQMCETKPIPGGAGRKGWDRRDGGQMRQTNPIWAGWPARGAGGRETPPGHDGAKQSQLPEAGHRGAVRRSDGMGKCLAGNELWYIVPAIGFGKTKPICRAGPRGARDGQVTSRAVPAAYCAKRTQFGPGGQPGARVAARAHRGTTAPNKANCPKRGTEAVSGGATGGASGLLERSYGTLHVQWASEKQSQAWESWGRWARAVLVYGATSPESGIRKTNPIGRQFRV